MNDKIPLLSAQQLDQLRCQVGTRSAELARELTWLNELDVAPAADSRTAATLRVVVFNAERGSRFDGIVSLLTSHPELRSADVLLLNEVDWGMVRSGNRHVARDLAEVLGMGYVFGIEFLELTKGEAAELDVPGENTWSLHGNAILSRFALRSPRLVRLPRYSTWAEGLQARVGGRMALIADIDGSGGPVTVACVHLENRATPMGRQSQMQSLLQAIGPATPAIIGGDLNTATIDGGDDVQILSVPSLLEEEPGRFRHPQRHEPLFEDVRAAGFLVEPFNPEGVTTNVPLGIPDPTYWLKLDWLFVRGAEPRQRPPTAVVVPAEWNGQRISDHDVLVADVCFGT